MDIVTSFISSYGDLFAQGIADSLVMTFASCFFAYVIGLPLGVAFALTVPTGLHPMRAVNTVIGWIINIGRSIPFVILMVAIIPFTRFIIGTSLGVPGAIVPLTLSAAPFVARIVEQSIAEVDGSLIEAAQAFGATTFEIVTKVMLKESVPSLIRGVAITWVNLFGYVAMAGTIGAGGVGDIAIRYGYQRWMADVMVVAVVICVILVQGFQSFCDWLAVKVDKRIRK